MTTTGVIIILCYLIGIIAAFFILRNREDLSTFDKTWWSIFWLPVLIWKVVDSIIKGW